MFKGLFTRSEEEERVDRDALRGERIERESDGSPVVVVAAAEQPDEEEKQEKTTTSIELFLSKNKAVDRPGLTPCKLTEFLFKSLAIFNELKTILA